MRPVGAACKFRMKLHSDIKRMIRKLDGFCQTAIRGSSADHQTCIGKQFAVLII